MVDNFQYCYDYYMFTYRETYFGEAISRCKRSNTQFFLSGMWVCGLRGVGLRKFDLIKISLIAREIREIFIIMKFFASKLSNIRSIAKTAPSFWLVLTYVAREHGSRWFSSKAPEKHQHFFSVVAWHCEGNLFLFLLIHCTCPLFG